MNYFEKNVEVLREHRPQLAGLFLSDRTDEARVRVTASQNGGSRVIFTKGDGEEVRIDRAEDQVKCARDVIDRLNQARPNKAEKEGLIVLLGFGLGYLPQELLKHFDTGHMMLIYEATPQLFKTALEVRDLTDILRSKKVEILVGPDVNDFSFIDRYHHHLVNGTWYVVGDNPSRRLNQDAYDRFYRRLSEEKRLTLSNVGTAVGLGKNFVDAFMQNVPNILRKPGVTALKNLFRERPAVVVAAGPSLEKNLHLLKKAMSKAVIIAVDATLPTLLPAGILPDVLVAIDPLPENVALFKDNPLLKHVPFICLTQYTPEIVDLYPGPLFLNMAEQNMVAMWLRPFWEDKGSIVCFGGSVAHLGFAAAEYLGCSTIGLVGLDLSFDVKFHAGDTSSLLTEVHGVPFEFKDRADKASDIFGEERFTLPTFLGFKTSFEKRITSFRGLVINTTEGGLPLVGAANMRLSDFIDEHCNVPELDVRRQIAELADTKVAYNLEGLIEEVTRVRKIMSDIRRNAWQILCYITRVQDFRKNRDNKSAEFHRLQHKIEDLTPKIRNPVLNLIAGYHYQLDLYLRRQDVTEIDAMEDKLKRLDAQLNRGLNYYGELLEALDLFLKGLERLTRSLRREQKINSIKQDSAANETERLYSAGIAARRAGRVVLATKYLEALRQIKGEELRSEDQRASRSESPYLAEINFSLAELYIRQYRYYEARELLETTDTQEGQGRILRAGHAAKVNELLETCREKIRTWEERKARMGDLVKKADESYGGSLESGLFYFRVGNYERAEKAYLHAVREQSKNQFPQLAAAFYGLAHTYLKLKENQKAVDAFAGALQADPGNPLIYRDLALLAIENGNVDSGEMFLTKALDLAPWSDEFYSLLARLYRGLGESGKAIALYEHGLQINPQNASLQRELATLYQDAILRNTNREGGNAG
jgi:hypothetical protein